MNKYIITTESTVDLSKEHLENINVKYICFHYELDGVEYVDDLGETISSEAFYNKMAEGATTKTSQVNVGEYKDFFTKFLDEGYDILHISLSSGLSGSVNSARIAIESLKEKYPNQKIYLVDSLAASSGFGLLVNTLAKLKDEGKTIEEVYEFAEENKLNVHHWFFTTTLTYFVRGGRVSAVSGFLGNILKICPLLNVSNEGKLIPREKIRTKRKVMEAIVDKMVQFADSGVNYNGDCYMCHSNCIEDANAVKDLVEEKFPNLKGKVLINNIGTTIGSHTGPGTVALFFYGEKRVN